MTTWDEVDSLTVSDFYEVGNYLGTISDDLDMDIVVVSVEDDGGNLTGDADLMIGAEGLNLGSHVIYGEEGTYIDVMGSGTLTAGGVEAYSFCVDPGSAVQISGDLNTDRDAGFINYGTVTVSGDLTAGTCYNDGGSLTVSGSVFYDDWFGCYGTDVTVGGDIIEEDDGDGYYNTMEIFDSSSATVGGSVDVWAVGVVGESTLTVSGDVTATDSICVGESEYDVDECVLTVGGDATVTGGDNCDWGSMQAIAGSTVFIGGDVYVAESLRLEPGESDEAARVIIGSEISGLDTTATQSYISINGRAVDAAEIDTSRFSEEEAIHLNNAYVTFHDSELGNDSDHSAYTHDLYVYGTSVLDGTFSGGFNFRGGTVMQMSYEGDETSLTDDENVEWIRYTAYELASKLSVTLAAYTTYTVYSEEKSADISFWTDSDADDLVVWLPTDAVLESASSNVSTRVDGISGVTADIPASALLSDADRELLARGYSIAFVLTVNDHNATVSDEDKALIAALTDSISTYYMDITLSKQVMDPSGTLDTDYTVSEITEISSNVTITILIPDTMQTAVSGKSGSYGTARVHDGAAAMLTTTYTEAAETLSFETDCFSTYAFTFTETSASDSTTTTTTTTTDNTTTGSTTTDTTTTATATTAAKTGDTNRVNLYFILIAVCAAGMAGAVYSRKRKNAK
ncbi:MAG: hypothetical protein LUD71_00280 [Clostridiales bacterium]|nr:hypothetical protein [Clostridiales bacterium]